MSLFRKKSAVEVPVIPAPTEEFSIEFTVEACWAAEVQGQAALTALHQCPAGFEVDSVSLTSVISRGYGVEGGVYWYASAKARIVPVPRGREVL